MTPPAPPHENTENPAEKPVGTDDRADTDPGLCPWCRTPVPAHTGRGRPRIWCGDQCRRDAHNARKAARTGAVGMQVIRQTRTVEKTVQVPVYEHRNPYAPVTSIDHLDEQDLVLHVLTDSALLAKILDSFAAGLGPRLNGRQLTGRLHESALRLAPLLEDYRDRVTPPQPETVGSVDETAGLSRQQRRAKQRLDSKRR